MKRVLLPVVCLLLVITSRAQNVSASLQQAFDRFLSDPQLQQAMASLHVVDAADGRVVFSENAAVGLSPASTQKVITSVTAYALLGRDFRYATRFGLVPQGSAPLLVVQPSGDPTLGSWRYNHTQEDLVLQRVAAALQQQGVRRLQGIVLDHTSWQSEAIPNGWIWEDLGNYFGAGAFGLNWRENQYDIFLRSGPQPGDEVKVVGTTPRMYGFSVSSRARAAAKGSGDQTLVYLPVLSQEGLIRGTIPAGEQAFKVSGAMPNPPHQFAATLQEQLKTLLPADLPAQVVEQETPAATILHTETSPPLDSIVYWLNQKSVNLYAEALLKTMAWKRRSHTATDTGVAVVQAFWKDRGVAPTELNLQDGSGLSPQNKVTTRAQVAVLLFAKGQPWFPGLYASLPLYNGMKMKSGTIGGVKGFTGYHTSKAGTTYAFSFLVNNYNGASSALVAKMYAVLNLLK